MKLSEGAVTLAGHRVTLAAVMATVLVWCCLGLVLGMPKEWFLLTNLFGTMVTLFMLLLMQHSKPRHASSSG